jgi:signal transduction histidine kinase
MGQGVSRQPLPSLKSPGARADTRGMGGPATSPPTETPEGAEPLGPGTSLRVGDYMTPDVLTVPVTATLREAAELLAHHAISCLVVADEGAPVGILSERDLVRAVVSDVGWMDRRVGDVMGHPLHVTSSSASVAQAIGELARNRIRRLPVVSGEGRLAGIVSQTDLLRAAHRGMREYAVDLERVVTARTTELLESERQREELIDLTVHDIKNSLSVIESAVEMIEMDQAQAGFALPLLRRASSRIGSLARTLLDVNRLESGAMPLRVVEVPWATVCDPLLAEMGLPAQAKGLRFVRSGETRAIVRCDAALIERVLLNLVDNAITAAPEGTIIDVHTERRADGAFLVRVGNRGQRIAPDVLPTLFDKYRQGAAHGHFRRLGGWGLGLTFCRLAVERHGGTIRAISPYVESQGAAFEFVLPAEPRVA